MITPQPKPPQPSGSSTAETRGDGQDGALNVPQPGSAIQPGSTSSVSRTTASVNRTNNPEYPPTTWPDPPNPLPSVHREGTLNAFSYGIWNTPFTDSNGQTQRYVTAEILSRNNAFNPDRNNREFLYPGEDKDVVLYYKLDNGFQGEYFYNGKAGAISADVRLTASFPRNAENARIWGHIGPDHTGSVVGRNQDGTIDTTPSADQILKEIDRTAFKIGGEAGIGGVDFGGIVLNSGEIDSNGAFTGTAALYRNVIPESQSGIMSGSFSEGNKMDVGGVDKATPPNHVAGQLLITGFKAANDHHPDVDPDRNFDPADNAITGVFVGNHVDP